jgi:hypothetical protein
MMNSNSFYLITQELSKQQQAMDALRAENQELRQQLADLRAGLGIFIEIDGNCFALDASTVSQISSVSQQATAIANEAATETFPVMPIYKSKGVPPLENNKNEETNPSTFLEEIMIGEFASAMASPLTVFQDPLNSQAAEDQKQKNSKSRQGKSKEEQTAILRHDLKGSYLLD